MSGMILQSGSLSDLPLLDLFLSARNAPFPTALALRRNDAVRVFHFAGGELAGLSADHPAESLASMLVRRRKLSKEQAEGAIQRAAADRNSFVETVLSESMLDAADLSLEMSLWATALLVQSFAWVEGSFELRADEEASPPGAGLLSVRLAAALGRGALKHLQPEVVTIYLSPWWEMGAGWSPDAPFAVDDFDLSAAQVEFCEALDPRRTLAASRDSGILPAEEAARLLFLLQRAECLQMAPLSPPEVAPAPPADDFDLDAFLDDFDGAAAPAQAQPAARAAAPSELASAVVAPRPPAPEAPVPRINHGVAEPPSFAPPPSRPAPMVAAEPVAEAPVDFSQIRFHRGAARSPSAGGTVHAERPGQREQLTRVAGPARVVGAAAPAPDAKAAAAEGEAAARVNRIASLFGEGGPVSPPRGAPSPPGGRRAAASGAGARPGVAAPSTGSQAAVPPSADETPPGGAGPLIEADEWTRLSTKEKERVRLLRDELNKLERTNYFEWFACTPDSQLATIKKAYFVAARRYHPDALVDEGPLYSRLAEALFARLTEAYDVLMDDEKRTKYHKKHILGEKDEDDLAMEKVQQVLAAEGAFKQGLKLLNAGKAADALLHFRKAVDGYADEPEYLAYLGYTTFRVREKTDSRAAEEGLKMLRDAADQRENNPRVWHLLGKAWMQKGDWEQAKSFLRRCLKIQPDNTEALREYKRADALSKGEVPPGPGGRPDPAAAEPKKSGFSALLGRFGGGKDGR